MPMAHGAGKTAKRAVKKNTKNGKKGRYVSGYIFYNKKQMNFYDGAATWNKDKKELRIYLFPYRLSHQAIDYIAKGKVWIIGRRRRKVKGKIEEYYLPAVQIVVHSVNDDVTLSKNADSVKYMFLGIEKTGKVYISEKIDKAASDSLKLLNISKDFLSFHMQGSEKDGESLYRWNFNISVPVLTLDDNLVF
jgi:hypothetical protein